MDVMRLTFSPGLASFSCVCGSSGGNAQPEHVTLDNLSHRRRLESRKKVERLSREFVRHCTCSFCFVMPQLASCDHEARVEQDVGS